MVLHTFDIVIDHIGGESQKMEEVTEQLVPVSDVAGQFFPSRGQNKPPVFFVFQQPLGVEFLNHIGDACLRDGEAFGDVHHARITFGIDELEDLLEIILNGGGGWAFGGPGRHSGNSSRGCEDGQRGEGGVRR